MKIGETKVIDQREQGSMGGGCWQEFLVLEKLNNTEFLLDVRRWDYLGEIGGLGFKEDEKGELIIPEKINGQFIEEVEDGFVFGGSLISCEDDQGEVKLTRPDQDEVVCWLKSVNWYDADVIKALSEEFSS